MRCRPSALPARTANSRSVEPMIRVMRSYYWILKSADPMLNRETTYNEVVAGERVAIDDAVSIIIGEGYFVPYFIREPGQQGRIDGGWRVYRVSRSMELW